MKLYNEDKKFLMNCYDKKSILDFYPELFELEVIYKETTEPEDPMMIALPEVESKTEKELVYVGNEIIDGVISIKSLDELTPEMVTNQKQRRLLLRLMKITDEKSKESSKIVAGDLVTEDLKERYIWKDKISLDPNNYSKFTLEAELLGKTVTEIVDAIQNKSNTYKDSYATLLLKVDAMRVKIASIINSGDLTNGKIFIDRFKELPLTATDDDYKNIFV